MNSEETDMLFDGAFLGGSECTFAALECSLPTIREATRDYHSTYRDGDGPESVPLLSDESVYADNVTDNGGACRERSEPPTTTGMTSSARRARTECATTFK